MKLTATALLLALACPPLSAATFVVTRMDDPVPDACLRSDCSLREALIAANARSGQDRVVLGAGTYVLSRATSTGSRVENRGPLWIRETVDIAGAGPASTRVRWSAVNFISRGMKDPVFYAWEADLGGEVLLRDMTISHGRGDSGGCVALGQQFGSYRLRDLVIEQCHALSGGGVSVNGSLLEMTRATLQGNTAAYDGGALSAIRSSTLLLNQVDITGNEAGRDGGGLHLSQHDLASTSMLTLIDQGGTRIHDNVAGRHGGGVSIAGDVQVEILGGINRLMINDNRAAGNGGGVWRGPRFVATQPLSTFIAHADISGNQAANGGGVATSPLTSVTLQSSALLKNFTGTGGVGGGLQLADETSSALLQQVSVHGNYAPTGGGIAAGCGSTTLQNVSMQHNSGAQGSAIDTGGVLSMTHVTVHGNSGAGAALLARDMATCATKHVEFTNSLIADSCLIVHSAAFSNGGNQYGPAASSCPALPGVDQRQASSAVFGLTVGEFGGPFPVSGWENDGAVRPQQNFVAPGAWCMSGDVRGQPRNDGACDAGAFEAQ